MSKSQRRWKSEQTKQQKDKLKQSYRFKNLISNDWIHITSDPFWFLNQLITTKVVRYRWSVVASSPNTFVRIQKTNWRNNNAYIPIA